MRVLLFYSNFYIIAEYSVEDAIPKINMPINITIHIASAILPVTIPAIAIPFSSCFTPNIPNIIASIEQGTDINHTHQVTIDTIPNTIDDTLSPCFFSLFSPIFLSSFPRHICLYFYNHFYYTVFLFCGQINFTLFFLYCFFLLKVSTYCKYCNYDTKC